MPVYLSKTLADNLFILQYPTKKTDIDPEESTVLRTSVKPINQEIKIAYRLNTASQRYDAFKGEQLAIAADGKVSYHMNFQIECKIATQKLLFSTLVNILGYSK